MNPGLYTLAAMTISDTGFVTAASNGPSVATNTTQQQQVATAIYMYDTMQGGADGGLWGIAP